MINKFRTRYPQGGLISELLDIDHGKYIVKVSRHVAGITLATGLAAADTVEAAEDQARIRALTLLDLEPLTETATSVISANHQNVTLSEKIITEDGNSSTQSPLPSKNGEQITKFADKPRAAIAKSPQKSQSSRSNVSPVIESSEPLLDTAEENVPFVFEPEASEYSLFGTPENESEDEPVAVESLLTPESEPEPILPVSPQPSKTSTPPISNEPTDFSEVIAKSNVEMKRLGWTNEQGRDYLVSTYGKRSRQLLDDHELIEFLHYLESQPTP